MRFIAFDGKPVIPSPVARLRATSLSHKRERGRERALRAQLFLLFFGLIAAAPAQAAPRLAAWSYGGMNNGEDAWGDLSPDYALCDAGTQQSPIDIAYTKIEKLPALKPDYRLSDAHIVRRDFTLVTNIDGNNTLTDDKNIYPLAQIRLHMPGEHHIHAAWWPLEIQLIHRDANNKILILSVLAQYGGANPALQSIIDHAQSGSARLDPMGLLPAKLGYYAYTGSLTSPPCTEGVEWRVLKQPITFSKQQALALSQFFGRNARLPQPVYMRVVRESKDK